MDRPVWSSTLLQNSLLSVSVSGLFRAYPKHFSYASLNKLVNTKKSKSSIKHCYAIAYILNYLMTQGVSCNYALPSSPQRYLQISHKGNVLTIKKINHETPVAFFA